MDILEYAMKMEKDGKAFYEEQARKTRIKELRDILIMLAEEEEKHYRFFKKMRDGDHEGAAGQTRTHSDTLKNVKNIFVEMAQNGANKSFADSEKEIWTEAMKIEERAESFYREKALEEVDATRRNLLNLIAAEERNHVYLIDGIMTYMKFPDTFSDTAQFKNFQSLEGH